MSEDPGTNEPMSDPPASGQESSQVESVGERVVPPYKEFAAKLKAPPPQPFESCGRGAAEPADLSVLFLILVAIGVIFPMYWRHKADHCPNDASRWNTVFYLVKYGTYEYLPHSGDSEDKTGWTASWTDGKGKLESEMTEADKAQRPFKIGKKWYKKPWDIMPFWTIDFVSFKNDDGTRSYYSSKPPLFPTCVAGVVMAMEKVSSWDFWPFSYIKPLDFADQEYPWHMMRLTVIIVQVIPFLVLVWLMARHVRKQTDSGFVRNFSIACAAFGTLLTPYLIPLNNHVVAAACVMISAYAFLKIWYEGHRSAKYFLFAGFFAAYAAALELPAASLLAAVLVLLAAKNGRKTLLVSLPAVLLVVGAALFTNWLGTGGRMIEPVYAHFGEEGGPYDFPGSYWMKNEYNPDGPDNMDALNEDKPIYLFNLLLGHHGFFLLTPIMFISLLGIVRHWFRTDDKAQPMFSCLVLMISMVVIGFYTFKTNNYGGGVQGPRWLFWLIPLWLLMLPSGVELLKCCRVGRGICYLLLLVSLLSIVGAMPRPGNEVPPFSDSWAHKFQRSDFLPDWLEINY
jgi:hypothetical protein